MSRDRSAMPVIQLYVYDDGFQVEVRTVDGDEIFTTEQHPSLSTALMEASKRLECMLIIPLEIVR